MRCPYCNGTGELIAHGPGPLIRAARDARQLRQEDVATRAGISRAQLANIESGRSDIPTGTLMRIAAAMDMRAGDLLP
ncbi:helix-turn-helix domain-containing protein [Phenylobacterium sp.]|uniref:helix-turn-helix domain-containing protein n=1 Tax=Phenylobacterium sp. TaxID=1871053 RepID=UPI0039487E26